MEIQARQRLLAMSISKAVAEDRVVSYTTPLVEHIVKVLAVDSPSREHWIEEIQNFLKKIFSAASNVKTKSGLLSDKFLIEHWESIAELVAQDCESELNLASLQRGYGVGLLSIPSNLESRLKALTSTFYELVVQVHQRKTTDRQAARDFSKILFDSLGDE